MRVEALPIVLALLLGAPALVAARPGTAAGKPGDTPPPPATYEQRTAEAHALASAGKFEAAAALLGAEIPRYPQDFPIHLTYAYYLLRAGEHRRAADAYRAARRLNDTYDARLGLADALIGAQRWPEAAELTARLAGERPADPGVLGRHAMALYFAGDHAAADHAYARLARLAPRSAEAQAGLGWTALRRGDRARARELFAAALTLDPRCAPAHEGLAALGPALHLAPEGHVFTQRYTDHPTRTSHWGFALGLGATALDRFGATVLYRRIVDPTTSARSRRGGQPEAADGAAFSQDEGFVSLAYFRPRWGVSLAAGAAAYSATTAAAAAAAFDTRVLGATARLTLWADLVASATHSTYADGGVTQLGLIARLPLTLALALSLGGEMQLAAGDTAAAGVADLSFHSAHFELGVTGRAGTAIRPVDLAALVVYNVPERPTYRVAARAALQLAAGVRVAASYERQGLETPAPGGAVTSSGQLVALGLRIDLPPAPGRGER